MLINTVIENATDGFRIAQRIEDPALFVAQGLTGGEVISFDVSNTAVTENGIIDPTDNSKWIPLLSGGTPVSISATTNYIFIQAPAYYRLVLVGIPASPITIMRFKYK